MAVPEYVPFDYFYTRDDEIWIDEERLKEYGLDILDVLNYKKNMMADRERWENKLSYRDNIGTLLQLIATVLAITLPYMIKQILCIILAIEEENSFLNLILTVLAFASMIALEWLLWGKEVLINWFNRWFRNKYQIRSQYDVLIEKYLEDCHWEWYKKMKPLWEREYQIYLKSMQKSK